MVTVLVGWFGVCLVVVCGRGWVHSRFGCLLYLVCFWGLVLSPVFSRFCLLLSMLVVGVCWVCGVVGVCFVTVWWWFSGWFLRGWSVWLGVWLAVVRWLAVGWIAGGGVLVWVVVVW